MEDTHAYSRRQWIKSVNLSALLGWFAFTAPMALPSEPGLLIWLAVFGLPIAFGSCWIIAAPILRFVMRQPVSWIRAAYWGAAISGLMAVLGIAIWRYVGWFQSLKTNTWYQPHGDELVRSIDGILTPYGWLILGRSAALIVVAGIIIALIIRAVIGPGKTNS